MVGHSRPPDKVEACVMCGIVGFWHPSEASPATRLRGIAEDMAISLTHRGPDDQGIWVDEHAGIALGSRRLAIVDLSQDGHQPMLSSQGRFVLTFNGEIYNYRELRRELAHTGHAFRGASDTEVMLTAFEAWGVEKALARFNGMFTFALWDRWERALTLGRDRVGEKPLYYGWLGRTFLFGSELSALRQHPHFTREINKDALALYLRHQYVPAPYSIYANVVTLMPGTMLRIDEASNPTTPPVAYWSLRSVVEEGNADPFTNNYGELAANLDSLLRDAVALRMVADVPLGAFLSGGVDSSLIVALMQAQSSQRIKTFSIGFHETAFNEAEYARAIAAHLGTEHTTLYVTPAEAIASIARLPTIYSEPFADPSNLPTLFLAELARKQVTVSLSGDGGDELFGGYDRYYEVERLWGVLSHIPRELRRAGAQALRAIPAHAWRAIFGAGTSLAPGLRRIEDPRQARRLAEMLELDDPMAMHWNAVSYWPDVAELLPGTAEPSTAMVDSRQSITSESLVRRMMYLDALTYLPSNNLVKVDRASMSASLEVRCPLLDPRVIEFAARIPGSPRRRGQTKWLLRQILHQYVPRGLIERPKMGLRAPIAQWLRGPLREWAEELLDERRLREQGFFNITSIRTRWAEHITGASDWHDSLWSILMFQAWYETAVVQEPIISRIH